MFKKILIIILIIIVVGCFYYIQPFKSMSTNTANGKIQYNQNCLSCHGKKGLGDGPLAASLSKRPKNINKKFKDIWKPDNRLTRQILLGKPKSGMPAFKGVLSESDAEDIIAYVRTIK